MLFRISLLAALVLSSGTAFASSDNDWNRLFAKVNGTCIGQSRLNTPEASSPVVFDDSTGIVAVLLRGSLGGTKSRSKTVNLLCLYDKRTGKASIEEYRWLPR